MKVNNSNANFTGKLYLKNLNLWTESMQKALVNNKSVQETLLNNDIVGRISTKTEKRMPKYYSLHDKGDTLYKVKLTIEKEGSSFIDKLKNLFLNKNVIRINNHYHSEFTTVDRLQKLDILE